MRLKIWTLLLAVLLAAPAFAQYGGQPGITVPPSLANKTIVNPNLTGPTPATQLTSLFKLDDDNTSNIFLKFTDVASPTTYAQYSIDTAISRLRTVMVTGANFTRTDLDTGNFGIVSQAGSVATTLDVGTSGLTLSTNNGAGKSAAFVATQNAVTLSYEPMAGLGQSIGLNFDGINIDPDTSFGSDGRVRFGNLDGDDVIEINLAPKGADARQGTLTTADLTNNQTYTLPDATGNFTLNSQLNHAVVDSGGAGAAVYSLVVDPGDSVATLDCLDADGCEVTLSETNAVPGQRLVILCTAATAGATTLKHSAGVVNLYNSADRVLPIGDAIEVVYIASTWSQIGNYDSAP